MVAKEWREKTDLIRPNEEFAVRAADKAANVATDKWFARESQRREHRHVQRERIPCAVRVAGPHCRITLNARVGRAGYHERAAIGSQARQAFVSCARH